MNDDGTARPSAELRPWRAALALTLAAGLLAACEPTVRVEAPREPITINLNIQADIRVKIEEQAKQDIKTYENIF